MSPRELSAPKGANNEPKGALSAPKGANNVSPRELSHSAEGSCRWVVAPRGAKRTRPSSCARRPRELTMSPRELSAPKGG